MTPQPPDELDGVTELDRATIADEAAFTCQGPGMSRLWWETELEMVRQQ